MNHVLLYAEHEPHARELPALMSHLDGIDAGDTGPPELTVLMPLPSTTTGSLMDELAAARGLSYEHASHDLRAGRSAALVEASRHLASTLATLRSAGHAARGELVGPASARTVLREVRQRRPDVVVLLSSPHRLAHLLRHDLEARLRHAGTATVVAVPAGRFRPRAAH